MDLHHLIEQSKRIAVIGMSANRYKPSHSVPKFFHDLGWTIIPINPTADEILGLKVYRTLADVEESIDMVNVFRPSEEAVDVVRQVVERKRSRGDVKAIWLQEGIFSTEAKRIAEENGLIYVEDRCMYKEY